MPQTNPTRALVRPPGDSYPTALTRLSPAPPIDLELAREQHTAYVSALRECGVDVIRLPPDPAHPDAVFVQDPVLVVAGCALASCSAAESRRGEADALLAVLEQYLPIAQLQPPATLDGGDVLLAEGQVYVGLSTRSNREACLQLATVTSLPVEGVPLPADLLHLLSGCTYLGRNRLLTLAALAPMFESCECIRVPEEEAAAANVLIVGEHAIVPAGYPHTAALVAQCGFKLHCVPISEFEKRDGGVTCLALLF
ncbi:MAG TPA: arginine deiminase-related protein [Anaerolineae bacterium]|nr:arginine deiminase-related protein [Anaerolineae bacterium]